MTFDRWFKKHYPNYNVPGGTSFKTKMRACWLAAIAAVALSGCTYEETCIDGFVYYHWGHVNTHWTLETEYGSPVRCKLF